MANSAIVKEEIEIKDEISEDFPVQLINQNFPPNFSLTPLCPSSDIQNIMTQNNANGLLGLDNNIAGIFSTETVGSKTLVVFRRLPGPLPESLKPPRIISKRPLNKRTECNKCGKFLTNKFLKPHLQICSKIFECQHCMFKAMDEQSLMKHNKEFHFNSNSMPTNVFQNCNKVYKSPTLLKYHTKRCGNNVAHFKYCDMCPYKSIRKYNLIIHIQRMHNIYRDDIKMKKSTHDGKLERFTSGGTKCLDSIFDKDKYLRMTYGSKKIVLHCEKCNKDIEGDRFFYRKQCENCQTNVKFRCTICDKIFTRYSCAVEHLNSTCDPQEMIQCSNCDVKAYTNFQILQHHRVVHGDIPIIGSRQLKQHLLPCKKETTFQCAHCPYKGKFKGNIRNHIKTCCMEQPINTNENSISKLLQKANAQMKLHHFCFICNKRKLFSYRLKNCQICNNAMHLWCIICDKAFAIDNPKACEHIKTFLDTYIHECECCGRYFDSVKKLMLHKAHHCNKKIIYYSCSFCRSKFNNELYLLRHEKRKHSKILNQQVLSTSKRGKLRQIDNNFTRSDIRTEKNVLSTSIKEKKTTNFFSCQNCNAKFVKNTDYSRHLTYCEVKLNMQCKVLLTRLKI